MKKPGREREGSHIDPTLLSSYREKLIEHLFVGELLKISLFYRGCKLEVARLLIAAEAAPTG